MDKKLEALAARLYKAGAPASTLNTVMAAGSYSGILQAVVLAEGTTKLAAQLGVSYQAVQQWVKQGYVPLARVTEIEALYGVPRNKLMNPKYAAALAAPSFSKDE